MLLAYLDEFGHIGPYIAPDHPKFNTHPVFGYGGFVLPAESVRAFGGYFEHLKESLLDFEIKQAGAHPRRWEKKGASLLTTRNHERYGTEIDPVLRRLSRKLNQLGGKAVFYGQVKPVGSAKETGESSADRSAHMLRQVILRLSKYADDRDEGIMIFLDAVDTEPRLAAVSATASFIYSGRPEHVKRVMEVPMQLESHFYGTTQYADWICAMLARSSHFHFVKGSEFGWSTELFRRCFGAGGCISDSKIRFHDSDAGIYSKSLARDDAFHAKVSSASRSAATRPSRRRPTRPFTPGISQRLGEISPELRKLRQAMEDRQRLERNDEGNPVEA
ncbi:DUF3800 domain-containing protein [Curtobacterium sp. 'Ferrero']|uniref:DUF3800 domain-containing protein n=1 Tax=Curtobacterium sp. 'Ferrero' TaxID=2033654 RepID=UPI0015970694|nr:DUF3800 domain-containing protein [Curtobacterium sp. 'Ferrero']